MNTLRGAIHQVFYFTIGRYLRHGTVWHGIVIYFASWFLTFGNSSATDNFKVQFVCRLVEIISFADRRACRVIKALPTLEGCEPVLRLGLPGMYTSPSPKPWIKASK